jgi:hypothetical protein
MSLSATVAAMKITYLLIAGCTGTDMESDDVGDCPTSQYVESWSGPNSKTECDQFINSKDFDPTTYMPGYPSYIVGCKPQPKSAKM